MHSIKQILLVVFFNLTALIAVNAKDSTVSIESLHPTQQHIRTTLVAHKIIDQYHYRPVELNNSYSKEMLHQYLKLLDINRSYFTEQDVNEFERDFSTSLDEAIKHANLEVAFIIFKRFRHRVDERIAHALKLLDYPFDFTKKENYIIDRKDSGWAKNARQQKALWRKRVKNDILVMKLTDKKATEIKNKLTHRYQGIARRVRQMTADEVFQAFMNAYTAALEPHTSYMLPHNAKNFDIGMRLSLQGIGAVLSSEDGYTVVEKVVKGGPADKNGRLKRGDKIIGVAQGKTSPFVDVVGERLQSVVEKIRGKKGSWVRLQVQPKDANAKMKEIVIKRDKINLEEQAAQSRVMKVKDKTIGVIELPSFYRDFYQASKSDDFRSTSSDVRKILKDLNEKQVDGIIIDLRNNGGGSLAEATELTGLFIDRGPIVQIRSHDGSIESEVDPDPELVYKGPLAVIVNRNSASASEIFAGAIQDYHRGIVVGEQTFGKGTVQQLIDLSHYLFSGKELGRLRITIAQFFRINGRSTQYKGVTPDIQFDRPLEPDHGEQFYDNALPWSAIKAASYTSWDKSSFDQVIAKHQQRIKHDAGFNYLTEEADMAHRFIKDKEVSLNLAKRKAQWEANDNKRRALRNKYRRSLNLSPLSKADEDNEDLTEKTEEEENIKEIEVRETARILTDMIQTEATPVLRAASTASQNSNLEMFH